MNRNKTRKKLALRKQTIRGMNEGDLAQANGGRFVFSAPICTFTKYCGFSDGCPPTLTVLNSCNGNCPTTF